MSAKPSNPYAYTLQVGITNRKGFTTYTIYTPWGSVYSTGKRQDTQQSVQKHYEKTVKRLNTNAGLSTSHRQVKTLSNGRPTGAHDWKRSIKEVHA